MPLLLRINISDQQLQFYISWKNSPRFDIVYNQDKWQNALFDRTKRINKKKELKSTETIGNLAMPKARKPTDAIGVSVHAHPFVHCYRRNESHEKVNSLSY